MGGDSKFQRVGRQIKKKKKIEDKQHDFGFFFFFLSDSQDLKSIRSLLCQPEVLGIWPRGLYQVKEFSYTGSSIFKVVGLMLHKVKEHCKLLVFPPNKPTKLRFECTHSRA